MRPLHGRFFCVIGCILNGMKRWGILGVLVIAVMALVPVVSQAAVNDFVISDYSIDYTLGRDDGKRSSLRTVETITAEFPMSNQNHGIERAIPKSYDGHSTSLKILSVTDQSGKSQQYTTYDSNDNLVVRIGDANTYVHGTQTYLITYQQRDVTRYFSNTGKDEFYWDTNGTEWRVPINQLSIRLRLGDNIKASVSEGNVFCYQGGAGSTERCEPTKKSDLVYEFRAENLNAGQNVTISMGFASQTFSGYQKSFGERLLDFYLQTIFFTSVIGIGVIIWLFVKLAHWSSRHKELGTIVPEYIPPKDTSLTVAASVSGTQSTSIFTAQLLDFAVRHYIKIYQTKDKGWFRAAQYDIEIVRDISDLPAEEQEILSDIFVDTKPGARIALKSLQNNTSVYKRFSNNDKKLDTLIRGKYGLRQRDKVKKKWFIRVGVVLLIIGVLTLGPTLLIASIVAFTSAFMLWPLTDKGLALSRYLKGLEMYIKVAETERLKMLQSPEGAQKVGAVDPNDTSQLVKLYERVLPYAVLFGQEKEWTKQIGDYYTKANSSPDWYTGNAAFNAAIFSSAISNFSSAASYTTASSSSSGGSSGGGSSGGGGGGGGGGGW